MAFSPFSKSLPPAYRPLLRFVEPARERAEAWRLVLVLVLTGVLFSIVVRIAISLMAGLIGPFWAEVVLRAMDGGRVPLGVVAVLLSFVPMVIGLALAVRVLHDRSWTSLIGPWRPAISMALWVGGGVLLLQLVLLPVETMAPQVGRHLTLAQQWTWAVPALIGIVIQSTTEEALFRGYLLQQLAVRNASPLVWMVAPAALFAALHLDGQVSGLQAGWTVISAFAFGLAAADLTARSGSLGPAIGLHVANNIGSLLMLGIYGQMDGLAAWNVVLNPSDTATMAIYMATDWLALLVGWLLARLILSR